LELFFLQPIVFASGFVSDKLDTAFWHFPKFNKAVSILPSEAKAFVHFTKKESLLTSSGIAGIWTLWIHPGAAEREEAAKVGLKQ